MTSSSACQSITPFPFRNSDALTSSKTISSLYLPPFNFQNSWSNKERKESIELILPTMSGFFSSDAEAALRGEDEALGIFYQNRNEQNPYSGHSASGSPYSHQQWTPAAYSSMSYPPNQASMGSFVPPSQYVSWPSTSLPPLQPVGYTASPYHQSSTPIVPSSPYPAESWSNAPWPALHPDDVEASSGNSRSVSPNPADLHNFGILLSDGKTWRCAHRGCTSQARFTRGCDLRKHFRRHTKSLFCRHEDCPQSREGGFSSRKDRDRHESRHKPGVKCSHPDCDRKFSRVDNMKDHVRRIHDKKS